MTLQPEIDDFSRWQPKPPSKAVLAFKLTGVVVGVIALLLFTSVMTVEGPKPETPYVVNTKLHVYTSPACYSEFHRDWKPADVRRLLFVERESLRLSPDRECANSGGLAGYTRSFGRDYLERAGLLRAHPRWNDRGGWNW